MSAKYEGTKLLEGTFEEWSTVLEAVLTAKDLWDVVGPQEDEPVYRGPKGQKERQHKVVQAKACIILSLDASQLPLVQGITDPRVMWNTLRGVHRSRSVNSILSLRRRFFHMRKRDDETTLAFITRVRRAANELSETPAPVSEIDQIIVITDGLPSDYATVITALDNLPFAELSMSGVMQRIAGRESQLEREQANFTADGNSIPAAALIARGKDAKASANSRCFNCGGWGHMATICPSPPSASAHIAAEEDLDAPPSLTVPPSLTASTAFIIDSKEDSIPLQLF